MASGAPVLANPVTVVAPPLLTADAVGYSSFGYAPQWGIYSGGTPVVTADAVVEFSYREEYTISDYTVESGAFVSYNKVFVPYDVRVRYVAGGSDANRAALLSSIEAVVSTTQLFSVVSPEAVYQSANIVHLDYRRTSNAGSKLLSVDVWLRQVLQLSGAGASGTSVGNISVGRISLGGVSLGASGFSVGGIPLTGALSTGGGLSAVGGALLTNVMTAAGASRINIGTISTAVAGAVGTISAQFPTPAQVYSALGQTYTAAANAVQSIPASLGF